MDKYNAKFDPAPIELLNDRNPVVPDATEAIDHRPAENGRPAADTSPSSLSLGPGQSPTPDSETTVSIRHQPLLSDAEVGHDPDLPIRDDRHALSTYEAGKLFEEARCRVSERTIVRWCNRNKRGIRRLDCAYDEGERRYFISEESVKAVIRDERRKGRQSALFETDLTDFEEAEVTPVGHPSAVGGPGQTATDDSVRHADKEGDRLGDLPSDVRASKASSSLSAEAYEKLFQENTNLKIDLARLQEQRETKDELLTFLRKEVDRRSEQINSDRELYERSLGWFRKQVDDKDAVIRQLYGELRALLDAPKDM